VGFTAAQERNKSYSGSSTAMVQAYLSDFKIKCSDLQRFALSIQLLPLPGHLVHLIILLHATGGGSERAISSIAGCFNNTVTTSKEKDQQLLVRARGHLLSHMAC